MKLIISSLLAVLLCSCVSTPKTVTFDNEVVSTFSVSAGCGSLSLDNDCSQMSGATKSITIDGIKLRISGGDSGKIVFVMSSSKLTPDQASLTLGAINVKKYLQTKGLNLITTKAMYSNETLFGIHYTFDGDAYALLNTLAVGK